MPITTGRFGDPDVMATISGATTRAQNLAYSKAWQCLKSVNDKMKKLKPALAAGLISFPNNTRDVSIEPVKLTEHIICCYSTDEECNTILDITIQHSY